MIIRRYFTIELIRVLLAVVGILLLIALSNRFVVLIGRAAYGNLSLSMVLNVLWYHIPDLLAFLLPLSLFLAILLVLGRWYTDRELTALQACGMPWRTILTPIFTTATLIALIVGSFTLFVVPKLQIEKEKLLRKEESVLLLETLSAEHFHALQSGRVVVYVEKISSDKDHMQHLFIAEKSPDTRSWSVLIANEATLKQNLASIPSASKTALDTKENPVNSAITASHSPTILAKSTKVTEPCPHSIVSLQQKSYGMKPP